MSYVVNWHRADGEPGWHPVGDVQEATTFVEHLRNAEGVETTRIYRLEEVAFEFRPYFRVELATAASESAAPVPAPEPVAGPAITTVAVDGGEVPSPGWLAPVDVPTESDVEPDADGAITGSGRRGLFGR